MADICVLIQVYNAGKYLEQCISSVLAQTYSAFDLILIDNGSTDESGAIIDRYAQEDSRIEVVRFSENRNDSPWISIAKEHGASGYCTKLDADDWWEPNYLERLISLAELYRADIVCTGAVIHSVKTGKTYERVFPKQTVLRGGEFAAAFLYYHVFCRTNWGKLYRMEVFQKADTSDFLARGLGYGGDTVFVLDALRHSSSMVLDNSTLYHYRFYSGSGSYRYEQRRFDSDVYLYNDAVKFLSAHGPVSEKNRAFLAEVYANAIIDTVGVIRNANLPEQDKLREYRRIAEHPVTAENFRYQCDEVLCARKNLLAETLRCRAAAGDAAADDFRAVLGTFAPACADVVTPESVPLFFTEEKLLDAVLADNREALLCALLELIGAQKHTKKYDLYAMVRTLSADRALLRDVDDKKFLRRYGSVYLSVWRGQYAKALDEMTGVLLDGTRVGETFLQLYLSLAALQNQTEAFVFGKVKLAALKLREGDKDACRGVLDDLAEMGVEENEEIAALRREAQGNAP